VGCLWPRPGFVGLPEVEMSPTSKEIFVDSHQHFWDPRALSWPAPTNPIFHGAFLPADLLQEIDPIRGGPHGTGTGISANTSRKPMVLRYGKRGRPRSRSRCLDRPLGSNVMPAIPWTNCNASRSSWGSGTF
jgi:hypothetical protein